MRSRTIEAPRCPATKEVAGNGAESILSSGDNLTDLQCRDDVVINVIAHRAAQFSLP
jgi:hypothetical protein